MRIRKLEIENLRGLSHVECEFDKPLNVIVGPNAIGKTTILESVRLTKALLMPRYFQEGQQVLVALGAASPHPQLSNYIDFSALARDPSQPTQISMSLELNASELEYLKSVRGHLAVELLRGQLARNDEQSQLALTQVLSSPEGRSKLELVTKEVDKKLDDMKAPFTFPIKLSLDGPNNRIDGSDPFNHSLVTLLER
jgi:hypothetical protein